MSDIIDTALAVFTVIYNIRLYSYVRWAASGARARVVDPDPPRRPTSAYGPGLGDAAVRSFRSVCFGLPLIGLTGSLE